jgi:hypothetical protein
MRNEFKGKELQNPHLHQFLRSVDVPPYYWLPPLDDVKLENVISSCQLGREEIEVSIKLGGKQPRLTELIAKALGKMSAIPIDEDKLISRLLQIPIVADHCRAMWNSLLPAEQEALQSVASGVPQMTRQLQDTLTEEKWVLTGEGEDVTFLSSLFGAYVKLLREGTLSLEEVKPGLSFDTTSSEAVVDGKRIPPEDLTPLERRLLEYLYSRAGQVCTKDDISEHVWESQYGGVSDEMIAQVVSTLRRKLDQTSPEAGTRYIETIRGLGYKLKPQAK